MLGLLLLLGACLPDGDGWKDLIGQEPPPIECATWFNTGEMPPTPEMLRGKVVLLEFFATTSEPCMKQTEALSALHEKYFDLGFRVISITGEHQETIEQDLIRIRRCQQWIACDLDGQTIGRFTDKKVFGIPKFFLINARGRVVAEEVPTEDLLEHLLEQRFDLAVLGELHADLAPARVLYGRGAYGAARALAAPLAESRQEHLGPDAARLMESVDGYALFLTALADSNLEKKLPGRAYGCLLEVARRFEGTDAARRAEERLKELREEPSVKKEHAAWREYEVALLRDVSPPATWRAETAAAGYERVVKGYVGTWAAWFAQDRLRRMQRP